MSGPWRLPGKGELLGELDSLDHTERLGRLARLAHEHREDPDLDALLDTLEDDSSDEYCLALRMAAVAGREERLLRALASEEGSGVPRARGSIRCALLATVVGRTAAAERLLPLLPRLAPVVRRRLFAQVCRGRRRRARGGLPSAADLLLPEVLARFGAREALLLLPASSPEVAAGLLPAVAHRVRAPGWRRLAEAHPGAVLEELERRLGESLPGAAAPWREMAGALPVLTRRRPRQLAEQLVAYLDRGGPAEGPLPGCLAEAVGLLLRQLPEHAGEILLHPGLSRPFRRWGIPKRILRALGRLSEAALPDEVLETLGERWGQPLDRCVLRRCALRRSVPRRSVPRRSVPRRSVLGPSERGGGRARSRPLDGLFAPSSSEGDGIHPLLSLDGGFERWPPRTRQTFSRFLHRVAGDGSRGLRERLRAIRLLGRLPATVPEDLSSYLASSEASIVEAALGALGHLDRPGEALSALLPHLGGNHARAAFAALRRCALRASPAQVLEHCASLPRSCPSAEPGAGPPPRPAVAPAIVPAVIALLWELAVPGCEERLAGLWREVEDGVGAGSPEVRMAWGRGARLAADRDSGGLARDVLQSLVRDPDPEVVRSLLVPVGATMARAHRSDHIGLLLAATEHGDREVRRAAFEALAAGTAGAREVEVAEAAARAVSDLGEEGTSREALGALLAVVQGGKVGGVIEALVSRWTAAGAVTGHTMVGQRAAPAGEPGGKAEGDLPARHRLRALIRGLVALPWPVRRRLYPTLESVIAELAWEPTLWPLAVTLRLAGVDWSKAAGAAGMLTELTLAAEVEPVFLRHLLGEVEDGLYRERGHWDPEHLALLLTGLDAATGIAARHLELVILRAVTVRTGWEEPWLTRLRALRRHPNLGVATVALDVGTGDGPAG